MLTQRSHDSWKYVCLILALLVALGGCATTGDTEDSNPLDKYFTPEKLQGLSPEEREMREDANEFRQNMLKLKLETVAGGTLVFGGTAFGLCMLKHGTDALEKEVIQKCGIIAAVAAVVGAVDGYRVAQKQEASRVKVRELEYHRQKIEERNEHLRKYVDSSRKLVERKRERVAELNNRSEQNEAQKEQLVEEKNRLQENIALMNGTISNLELDRDTYQRLADELDGEGEDVARLRSQVESMNLQIAALEQERNLLEEINLTVVVG